MREVVVGAFVTLDGVMQAPGGPQEDPSGGFAHGGWSVNHWDEAMGTAMTESMAEPFALLLGRRTYEIFAAHWPHAGEGVRDDLGGTASGIEDPAAELLNSARKYVASRTLEHLGWRNSELLDGDVAEAVAALKAEDGPRLLVQGSTELIQTLLAADLVDELRVWTFPVLVGPGKRLFGDGTRAGRWGVADSAVSGTGVVMTTYRRAGEIDHGSFAFDTPTAEEVARRERLAAEDWRAG